jgi:hypothetical protein
MAALHAENRPRLALWLPAWPAAWGALAVAGRVVFPISLAALWLVPLVGALLMMAWLCFNWHHLRSRPGGRFLAVFGAWWLIGAGALLSQRPPPPDTRPILIDLPADEDSGSVLSPSAPAAIKLDPGVMVYPREGSLTIRAIPLTLIVNPLLTFLSCSPDGCWTVLARQDERNGPEPRLLWARSNGNQSPLLAYELPGQGQGTLRVAFGPQQDSILIEAECRLDHRIYSHLNSYCDLEVRGHHRLALGFSPCPETRIDVRKFDYPFGRPSRFAFVEEDRRFRVVEATSGEKGPFRTLAAGRLEPAEPLAICLFDEGARRGSSGQTLSSRAGQPALRWPR